MIFVIDIAPSREQSMSTMDYFKFLPENKLHYIKHMFTVELKCHLEPTKEGNHVYANDLF